MSSLLHLRSTLSCLLVTCCRRLLLLFGSSSRLLCLGRGTKSALLCEELSHHFLLPLLPLAGCCWGGVGLARACLLLFLLRGRLGGRCCCTCCCSRRLLCRDLLLLLLRLAAAGWCFTWDDRALSARLCSCLLAVCWLLTTLCHSTSPGPSSKPLRHSLLLLLDGHCRCHHPLLLLLRRWYGL
jgi:hypothetical protein